MVVLIGGNLGMPTSRCASRLGQLPDGRFSHPGADPPRRQPPGLLAGGPVAHLGRPSAAADAGSALPSNWPTKPCTASCPRTHRPRYGHVSDTRSPIHRAPVTLTAP